MNKYYIKTKKKNLRKIFRFAGLGISVTGLIFGMYMFFPLISWEFYLKPVFAAQAFASPIPKTTVMTQDYIKSLWHNTTNSLRPDSQEWLPSSTYKEVQVMPQISSYYLSIPKLNISNALISTVDTDLDNHLVHFPGTPIPPAKGNAAIFGHSTLPQLYDPKNYKTIFANIHTLTVGDTFLITNNNALYTYKIINVSIVDPEDTSYLTQDVTKSTITIITCTPPGTIWKRLILKAQLQDSL